MFSEPHVTVAELACALDRWLQEPDRGDFRFDSLDCEDVGYVTIAREGDGWVAYSVWQPDVRTRPVPTGVMEGAVRDFVRAVEQDRVAEGLDADRILGRTVEAPTTVEPVWICPSGGGPVVVAVRPAGGEALGMCRTCAGIYDDVDRGGGLGWAASSRPWVRPD